MATTGDDEKKVLSPGRLATRELKGALRRAAAAAQGDSNDGEIEALQEALELALTRWPIAAARVYEQRW